MSDDPIKKLFGKNPWEKYTPTFREENIFATKAKEFK